MLRALDWMKENKVDVLNLSFAGPKDRWFTKPSWKLAKSGTVILAAAGNDGPQADADLSRGLSRGDRGHGGRPEHGGLRLRQPRQHIAVAAPGVDVWTAMPDKREGTQTGTSFAVPFATSVVAWRSTIRPPISVRKR